MFDFTAKGSISAGPANTSDQVSLDQALDLDSTAKYDAAWGSSQPINGTSQAPFVLNLGAVAGLLAVAIRAVDGQSLVVRITSSAGVDQAIPVSDLFVLKVASTSDQITAVKIVGTGRIEYLVGGNR